MTQLGKTIETMHNRRHPHAAGHIPVIYITAPPQWQALIAALEGSLRLHRHRDGTLVELAAYLHGRSSGMIGSLLRLVRAAAIQAVLDGSEAITKATLESIPVDIASAGEHLPR